VKVYHYTNKSNLNKIMAEGLIPHGNSSDRDSFIVDSFTSLIRKCSSYFFLDMATARRHMSKEDVLLEVEIKYPDTVFVGDFDLASNAVVEYYEVYFCGRSVSQKFLDAKKEFESNLVRLSNYNGQFNKPEVLVPYYIHPKFIQRRHDK